MPLPILPDGLEAGLRQFMRQSQIGTDVLMDIINEALGATAQQPEKDDPVDDEDPDQVIADATILVPDEELNPHAPTELQALRTRMPAWRVRQLKQVHSQRGFKRNTSRARRQQIRRRTA